MSSYVCAELLDVQNGYTTCKTWVAYEPPADWVDKLALTPQQMGQIGTPIIIAFGIILAYAIIAKAIKML